MKHKKPAALLRDLYLLSGVRVTLFDRHRHCLVDEGPDGRAGYCVAVQTNPLGLARCAHSDAQAFQTVEKTGRPFVFTCPFGLFEAVVPLLAGERLMGFLFAGSAIVPEERQRKLALEEATPYVGKLHTKGELKELVDALAAPNDAQREALLHMLELLGQHIVESGWLDNDIESLADLAQIYLDRNYHRKLSLSEISLHFHCSTVTLTEAFRHAFGCTIVEYLTEKRLLAAASLLRDSEFSVGTVAEKCGFSGTSYFSKAFKRRFGTAPLPWRQQQRRA
jgi:AraC-like DNA-binding protein